MMPISLNCYSIYIIFVNIVVNRDLVSGKIVEGSLVTHENWMFLARFCFYNYSGEFQFHVRYPVEYQGQKLLLYFDDETQWPAVYKSSKTCEEKISVLSPRRGQFINLTVGIRWSGCKYVQINENEQLRNYTECSHHRMFNITRARWWYIAISNCENERGLKLNYKFIMTNDNVSYSWLKHFSADESYIIHTDFTFLIIYSILIIIASIQAYLLNSRRLFHATYKLFYLVLILQLTGLIFMHTYYLEYAADGKSLEGYKITGNGFFGLSSLAFLLLLILIAKGYTVTRARLKSSTTAKISVFMTIYAGIHGFLFFYEAQFFDPGEVLYTYESIIGFGLISLRIVGFIWFSYSLITTAKLYPTKRWFFILVFIMYSVWFISTPMIVLLATAAIPNYMREKIVNGVDLTVHLRAHIFFMLLTWPARFNKVFPYHVRTTQINVLSKNGQVGGETIERFSHYSYAPSVRPATQQSMIQPNLNKRITFSKHDLTTSHGIYNIGEGLPDVG